MAFASFSYDNAMQAWEETVDFNSSRPDAEPEPAYPKEVSFH